MNGFSWGIILVIVAGVLEGFFTEDRPDTQLEVRKHPRFGIARGDGAGSFLKYSEF
jgi:hypothetical protein